MKDENFHGVKVAVLCEEKLLMQHRDNKPGLFNANLWDFPGGGREGDETPETCAIREVKEEFGIELKTQDLIWKRKYPARKDPTQTAYFMVAKITSQTAQEIKFGKEGQGWGWFDQQAFLIEWMLFNQYNFGTKII